MPTNLNIRDRLSMMSAEIMVARLVARQWRLSPASPVTLSEAHRPSGSEAGSHRQSAMNAIAPATPIASPVGDRGAQQRERRLEQLIDRLPKRVQGRVRWLRRPSSRWIRIPAGILLIVGGLLSILPILGLWMLPLGLMLLAEDVPFLRRAGDRLLDWIERRRPHWLQGTTK
jgi:hypothetical protein